MSDPYAQRLAEEGIAKLRDLTKSKGVSDEVQRAIDESLGFPGLAEAETVERTLLEASKRKAEELRRIKEAAKECVVTTADLQQPYDVIGPVFFQLSNKGLFSSTYDRYYKLYLGEIRQAMEEGAASGPDAGAFSDAVFAFLTPESHVGQGSFDSAFYIATQELKLRAAAAGGDAVVGMRMDFDLDTTGIGGFYLQMYGTAVKTRA